MYSLRIVRSQKHNFSDECRKANLLICPPVTGVGVSFCWKAGTVKRGIFAQRKGSGQKIQRVKSYHKDEETVTILCQFHP